MVDSTHIDGLALKLRDNAITAERFVRETRPHWRVEAERLYRRWRRKLPDWVQVEDVEQAMVANVLYEDGANTESQNRTPSRMVDKWDPTRGVSIAKFITFGARTRTKRWIHRVRGASTHGSEGKNLGHFETTFSKVAERRKARSGGDGPEFDPLDLVPIFVDQDARAAIAEMMGEQVEKSETLGESYVWLALRAAHGDPDDAAAMLYRNFSARVELELRDVEHARRLVGEWLVYVYGDSVESLLVEEAPESGVSVVDGSEVAA